MLKQMRRFFGAEPNDGVPAPDLRLSLAVLLVEVLRSDQRLASVERTMAAHMLEESLALAPVHAEALLDRAEKSAQGANDFYAFTSVVNAHLTHPEKIRLVERMWHCAMSDGATGAEERHTIWRLAGLLHLTHGEYIAARLRAREAAGLR